MANEFNSCKKTGTDLKKCAKCHTTFYCSRDCQKVDWKVHKKVCNPNSQNNLSDKIGPSNVTHNNTQEPSRTRSLDQPISKPYTRLHDRKWLHDRPEKDVYRLLIDCYRMRMEDKCKIDGRAEAGSVQAGASNLEQSFRRLLHVAEAKPDLLPPWWDDGKKEACVKLVRRSGGEDGGGWSCLSRAATKEEIIEHYGNPQFPMHLRLFGEQIFGYTPGSQGNGAQVIELMMMAMEAPGARPTMFGHFTLL
ncbi:hypothetical protein PG994_006048 [Apiospora phragmitis]|uniref:MYND-type domain-containing protein n=1 Tax=Apiospora phragmitis TaxID=2905665 RepID=A0ABR1VE28_9PEZI